MRAAITMLYFDYSEVTSSSIYDTQNSLKSILTPNFLMLPFKCLYQRCEIK
ncbi:hypothetical protein X975_16972, partial [Stegodyphus mimosarum]